MTATWISSPTGGRYDSLTPASSEYTLQDLCDSVSEINRFNGSAGNRANVASHLIRCHKFTLELYKNNENKERLAKFAAIHDLHEAFIGDIATPIQNAINAKISSSSVNGENLFKKCLHEMKAKIDKDIFDRIFNELDYLYYERFINSKEFKIIDESVMCYEAQQFLNDSSWTYNYFPLSIKIDKNIFKDIDNYSPDQSGLILEDILVEDITK